ncbi:helix-turn-helix transcriptional regulator [Paenibacillus thermotolerans]|uniref:helix-turn-helix transcriptional regulator n=1 Tax=Paenibacillus thermotolerans TaxID=3027807 RepID=UPI002367EC9B|nr:MULTISPECIES: LuxR C-terminal-related transcriptional regulator [unclassified Paenibacillus]
MYEKQSGWLAGEIDRLSHHYLVGRDREIRIFQECLADDAPVVRILNIYGTGGVGKSYLLDEFRRFSEKAGVRFLFMDCRAFSRNPSEFCLYLLHLLRYPGSQAENADTGSLIEICADEIGKDAAGRKFVLALDTFEELGDMEHWLREEFLTRLSPNILTILSGRLPLQGTWRSSPAWRQMICRLPIDDFAYEDVKQYLDLAGIRQEETVRHIWARTKGHPLTLSLFVSTTLAQMHMKYSISQNGHEIFPHVVSTWLKEVPDPEIRELVEAAAVLRHFNQETLGFILERQVTTEQFLKLISHSFIRRVDRGWLLHDLLRDAIGREMRRRMPEYYDKLWKRCVLHYYLLIKASIQKKSVSWESAEWVYYIGDRLIRTLFYHQSVTYQLEPLHPSNLTEAERYIEERRQRVHDMRIQPINQETDEQFEYWITAEESLLGYKHFALQEIYDLDPNAVKLIRDPQGKVCGMTEIVPIHEGTLDFLMSKRPFSAYFTSLSESKLKELRTPPESIAGYFVAFIDVRDYSDLSMLQAAGLTFITYMLSAGLVVTTAPMIPFFRSVFQSLGLEKVKDAVHFDYYDHIPTPYFVMDTRGRKLIDYLNKMIATFGLAQDAEDVDQRMRALSKRERDVVSLLLKGRTNSEIAGELCLSEATVKKHVLHIFRKLQVKNRIQLMNHYSDL